MKTFARSLALFVLFVAALPTPGHAWGRKPMLYLFSDRGLENDSLTRKQRSERNQVGKYLEKILVKRLKKAGYKPRLVHDARSYVPGENTFLLYVTITHYERRGAYPFLLETRFELSGMSGTPLVARPLSVHSRRSWAKCAIKTAKLIARAVPRKQVLRLEREHAAAPATNGAWDAPPETTPGYGGYDAGESAGMTVEQRLARLNNMLDRGLITYDDYEVKKREILSEL
jgi:hypothetical protein